MKRLAFIWLSAVIGATGFSPGRANAQCAPATRLIVNTYGFTGTASMLRVSLRATSPIPIDSEHTQGTRAEFLSLTPPLLPDSLSSLVVGAPGWKFNRDGRLVLLFQDGDCIARTAFSAVPLWLARVDVAPLYNVGLLPPHHPCPGVPWTAPPRLDSLTGSDAAWCVETDEVPVKLPVSRDNLERAQDSTLRFYPENLRELQKQQVRRGVEVAGK